MDMDLPLIRLSRWRASCLVENWSLTPTLPGVATECILLLLPFRGPLPLFQVVGVPYIVGAVGITEHVNVVSQSGASLVHFIAPCNPQAARSFDRLRMKGKGLRMMVGGQEWKSIKMRLP